MSNNKEMYIKQSVKRYNRNEE